MKKYDGLFRGSPNLAKFGLSGTIFRKTRGPKIEDGGGKYYTMRALNDPKKGGVEFRVLTMKGHALTERYYVTVNFGDLEAISEDEAVVIELMLM